MTLLLILVLTVFVLFAVFLGGSIIAQGYLYQAPADRLPVRALVAAALVGLFLTLWAWVDKRNPKKYDTFFEFAPYETKTFDEFDAVRWTSPDGSKLRVDASGNPVEAETKFRRGVGAKSNEFFEDGSGDPFHLQGVTKSSLSYMTAAVKLKPEKDGEAVRFNAQLNADKRTYAKTVEGRRFVEDKGSRYVQAEQLGVLYVPSNRTVFLAIVINVLHYVAWFVAFWAVLQYTRGHAFVLAVAFGTATMLLVMPLLFKPNRAPKPAEEAPKAAVVRGGDEAMARG